MSGRRVCGLLGIALSSHGYRSRREEREEPVRERLIALAHEHPRYGSPRLCVLLNRESRCNHKRVERLYREAGLSLRIPAKANADSEGNANGIPGRRRTVVGA